MINPNWMEREDMVSEDKQEDLWGASVADWAEHEADHAPSWQAMLSNMNVQKGSYLLDAGCGAGGGAKSAIELGAQVYGIDKSPAMISYAKTHVPLADFQVGDLEKCLMMIIFLTLLWPVIQSSMRKTLAMPFEKFAVFASLMVKYLFARGMWQKRMTCICLEQP